MVIIKLITTLFIQLDFWNGVRDLVLSPFGSAKVELFMVMLVIPFFVNVNQNGMNSIIHGFNFNHFFIFSDFDFLGD